MAHDSRKGIPLSYGDLTRKMKSPLIHSMFLNRDIQPSPRRKLLVDHGFSKKPALNGIGPKAGEAYAWAVPNPDKVSCIYARNPLMKSLMAGKQHPVDNLAALAKAGVPVLHDCGALDPWLDKQTRVVEKRYQDLGGKITVIVRAGEGHFPLSPKDPKSVVDFIVKNAR
jgi:hypothetical protein